MKKTISLSILLSLIISLFVSVAGQTQQQSPSQQQDDVVRITSSLVQLDAVVTDKDGNQITDLTADDFEILQDGKPQKISNLSYIGAENTTSKLIANTNTVSKKDKNVPPVPPVIIRPGNPGRILTFVVDDGNCDASLIGITAAREGLEKFVNEQMQPGDVAAIYQTRQGSSTLQQYTSDKAQLTRVIRKIRFLPALGCDNTGDFFAAARGEDTVKVESEEDRKRREANEDFNTSNKVVGTIGVLRYVVDGLKRVGGRKIVFFMSDGIPLIDRDGRLIQAAGVLRDLTEAANRASVVFNTIDVRGVYDASFISAKDDILTRFC